MNNLELQKRANDVRKGIVTSVHSAKAGHPGGSLSAADVFTFLYFAVSIFPMLVPVILKYVSLLWFGATTSVIPAPETEKRVIFS